MVTNMVTKIFHIFLSYSATNIPRNETFLFKQASPFENMRSASKSKLWLHRSGLVTYSYYYHVLKTSEYCFWSRSLEKMMKKNSRKRFLFRREAGLRRHVQGAPERLHHRQGQQVRDPSLLFIYSTLLSYILLGFQQLCAQLVRKYTFKLIRRRRPLKTRRSAVKETKFISIFRYWSFPRHRQLRSYN
jgi:hypothetical protein